MKEPFWQFLDILSYALILALAYSFATISIRQKAPRLYFFIERYNEQMDIEVKSDSKIIGWREWGSFPLLGLIAIKGKVDTGAKTSSLHAFDISLEKVGKKTFVNFKVHPIQGDFTVVINCRAPLVDIRSVTDSGGHKEDRYVIRTMMVLGSMKKKVELTLSNRETMKFRLLIGREALKQFYIDPSQSYLMGRTVKQKRFLKELKGQMKKA